ncbi:MAG: hypothetical protein WDM85_09315 [Caulobacteraceae bacterium]
MIQPVVTRDYMGKLCAAGSRVTLMTMPRRRPRYGGDEERP